MNPATPIPNVPPAVPQGLEDDEVGASLVREELRLLATVRRALDAAREAEAATSQSRVLDDQRLLELRDDVAVAKPDDLPALFEQMHTLSALRTQRGKGAVGTLDAGSPYFGHLRLEEGGRRRDVLIGGRSYVDASAGIRVVDWRNAPVSRIYYRYAQGDDYEESLGGRTVEGVVVARRSVAIVDGELVRVTSPEGTFARDSRGDRKWRRIDTQATRLWTSHKDGPRLGVGPDGELRDGGGSRGREQGDKHLSAISAMLDKDQFDLIARPSAGLVAIQGSAGSGKTTVGLHRVAYLAHTDAQRYRPDRMLVVVPNEALKHYVGRVLPSLGVEGVPVVTFASYGPKILAGLLPKLPTSFSEDTPPVVVRAKMHPRFLHAIEAAAARLDHALDLRVREGMERWPDGAKVIRAWEATRTIGEGVTPEMRVHAMAQWLIGKRKLANAPLSSELPDVTRSALEALGHELRTTSRAVLATFDELVTDRGLLGTTFAGEPTFGPGQLDQVHEWCVRRARLRAEGERDGDEPALDTEDVALLLRLWQVVRGPLATEDGRPIRFAHIFVDEVQDASPIELRVLLDMAGADRCVTFAGDVAQRLFADVQAANDAGSGEFDWGRLLEELGVPHTTLEPLKVSYRSTAEITTFARAVLGPLATRGADGDAGEPIAARHGPPVELFTFASPGEAVAFLADALRQLARDEPYANVALVARFAAHAEVYFDGLMRAEVPNLRRVAQQDFTWAAGFDVTDVRQTKGLEFDEVVLLETTAPSYPDNAAARHALYVGATRAVHQLWCIASDKPSPLVVSALAPPDAPSEETQPTAAPVGPVAPPSEVRG